MVPDGRHKCPVCDDGESADENVTDDADDVGDGGDGDVDAVVDVDDAGVDDNAGVVVSSSTEPLPGGLTTMR